MLNLNINKDDSELNDFLICWEKFESRPNKIVIHNTYSSKLFINLFSEISIDKNFFTEVIPTSDELIVNDKMFVTISDNIYCSYIIIDRKHESSIINEVTFYYKLESDFTKIQEILDRLNTCIVDFEEDENKLNTLTINSGSLELEPIDISNIDIENFNIYYSKSTSKELKKLTKEIKNSNKGLSIIYGERGTGKTSIINYLATKLDRIVIFIPNNMIEHTINNSEFRKFLKRFSKPIIIMDDCEMLFHEYFTKSNMFTNNLLQMIDGFLSDTLEVNIVTIFNVESEDDIDHSLLDCNNLLKVINVESLSSDESNKLSKHLGFDKVYKNKSKVIDITKNKKTKPIKDFGL